MSAALVQIAGRVGEGLVEDDHARDELARVRKGIDDIRLRLARRIHDRDVWLVNALRERETELEASVVGWDRLLPLFRRGA